ncbi:hypothetical protein SRHO_G00165960 [Serrasalmus rhombeus]
MKARYVRSLDVSSSAWATAFRTPLSP